MPLEAGWNVAPIIVLALAGYVVAYGLRWKRSREQGGSRAAGGERLVLWVTGVGILAAALISPLDTLGEQLASAHMVQHLLIADLAPIALTLALTKHILRPVTKRLQALERAAGPLGHPVFGVIAYVGVMWAWHIPALYDAALTSPAVHTLEHLSFGAAGLLYWWHLLSPIRTRLRLQGMGPLAYMAGTKLLVGFLGVVLAFSPTVFYEYAGYADGVTRLGLTALEDQHVAGLIMALEQSIVMGIALAWLFARMLSESEQEDQRAERYASP